MFSNILGLLQIIVLQFGANKTGTLLFLAVDTYMETNKGLLKIMSAKNGGI